MDEALSARRSDPEGTSSSAAQRDDGWWSPTDVGIAIRVRVVPNARQTELVGTVGDALRVRVAAPASDGEANDRLRRFLAELFDVGRSNVRIVRGRRSRSKTVQIVGFDDVPHRVRRRVDRVTARRDR